MRLSGQLLTGHLWEAPQLLQATTLPGKPGIRSLILLINLVFLSLTQIAL